MKQTGKVNANSQSVNFDYLEKMTQDLMKNNPRLQEMYETTKNSIPDKPITMTDAEKRKVYQELFDRKMNGEPGIQADWEYILKWLKEHPEDNDEKI